MSRHSWRQNRETAVGFAKGTGSQKVIWTIRCEQQSFVGVCQAKIPGKGKKRAQRNTVPCCIWVFTALWDSLVHCVASHAHHQFQPLDLIFISSLHLNPVFFWLIHLNSAVAGTFRSFYIEETEKMFGVLLELCAVCSYLDQFKTCGDSRSNATSGGRSRISERDCGSQGDSQTTIAFLGTFG